MDDTMNRLAREMADAIAAAVGKDPQVQACRDRARVAGYELQVSIEANIGFAPKNAAGAKPKAPAPPKPLEMSANDRRFLRSLRIAPDETKEEVE
jgi:hypothetical protein